MKKIFLFTIFALFFGVITSPEASAQHYQSRVLNVCPVCHQNVYAQYRPINYGGAIRYSWVPLYHTRCASRGVTQQRIVTQPRIVNHTTYAQPTRCATPTRYVTKYHRGVPYRYAVPTHTHGRTTHVRSPRYSGFTSPGFSITIRR